MNESIRCERDLVYGAVAQRDLLCDVYFPNPALRNGAASLVFHPGGWNRGDRAAVQDVATALATRGYLAAAVGYRLTGEAPWPAQLQDTRTAIRWLRANATRFDIDPDLITLTGLSAGAHLSLLAAGTAGSGVFRSAEEAADHPGVSEHVAAVAALYPPTRLDALTRQALALTPSQAAAASPLTYASAAFPPTLFLHGAADTIVPAAMSQEMFTALTAAGVLTDLRIYGRLPHAFVRLPGMLETAMNEVAAFFDRAALQRVRFEQALAELNRFLTDAQAAAAAPARQPLRLS